MYFFEWVVWREAIANKAQRKERDEFDKRRGGEPDFTVDMVKADYTQPSVSENPRPFGPYYAYNECFMEIRAGFMESYRGVITVFTLLIFVGFIWLPIRELLLIFYKLMYTNPYKVWDLYLGIVFFR